MKPPKLLSGIPLPLPKPKSRRRGPQILAVAPVERAQVDELATKINAEHAAVCAAAGEMLEHARLCGELLLQAKAKLQHGEWLLGWRGTAASACGRCNAT